MALERRTAQWAGGCGGRAITSGRADTLSGCGSAGIPSLYDHGRSAGGSGEDPDSRGTRAQDSRSNLVLRMA